MVEFINNIDHLRYICERLEKSPDLITSSDLVKYFLECFKPYYQQQTYSPRRLDLADMLLVKNSHLLLNEMETCINRAFADYSDDSVSKEVIKEVSVLTENSNYIHRPALDNELITRLPSSDLHSLHSVDVLIGVTSHEAFYFLFHEYNINEILLHAFIYSSLINSTDNLVLKLAEVHQNREVNIFARFNFC